MNMLAIIYGFDLGIFKDVGSLKMLVDCYCQLIILFNFYSQIINPRSPKPLVDRLSPWKRLGFSSAG